MPNWVYNTMTVTGSNQVLDRFTKQAATPYVTHHYNPIEKTRGEQLNEGELLFWNFAKPPESVLEEYWGPEPRHDNPYDAMKRETNHWYDWNHRNWGTKWEACDPEIIQESEGLITYHFRTAWADPRPVFEEMAKQYPDLKFSIGCNEEQGWGLEYYGSEGELTIIDQWEIPASHAEREDRTGECECNYSLDYRPYDDCPLQNEVTA